MEEIAGHAAEFVDDIDTQVPDETVHFLLCLGVEPQPGRLQGVDHEKPVGRVECPAPGAEVLGSLVRLCRRGVAVGAEVGLREGLHHHTERASLADPAASEPDGSVVVGGRRHGQADSRLVRPRIETLLK